jgi:hypothetical protein
VRQRAISGLCVRDHYVARRRRRTVAACLSLSVLGIVTVGPQLIVVQAAQAATRTPAQVLASSLAAAKAESSFHYVSVTKLPGKTLTLTGDVSRSSGEQTIVVVANGSVGHLSESLVGGSAYFRGDQTGLVNDLGLPSALATQYANRWISLTPSDREFDSIATALTTSSALAQMTIGKPLSLRGTEQRMGQRVLTIAGTYSEPVAGSSKRLSGPVRLYVNDTGNSLPVFYMSSATFRKKAYSQSMSFDGWGEVVSVSAPAGAVPVGSIGTSTSA